MAKDLSDVVRDVVGNVARETLQNLGDAKSSARKSKGAMTGVKGLAAGAGLAAVALKGGSALRSLNPAQAVEKATSKIGDRVEGVASDKVDEAGGAGGMVKNAVSGALPFGGGGDDDDSDGGQQSGMPGVGKGRRMPIQQAIDVAVPLETAYNQWTQYEDWPEFMHRVTRVTQSDECTVAFATKIWGKTKEFTAEIVTQRPDDRVKWRVSEGITHTGVVSFHELAPRLTRIEIDLDIDPGSLIEKAARGMRHIKRAVRADLHRFKAFIEMQEVESGAWRGVIEDGEVVEDHDESYDKDRDYAEVADIYEFASSNGDAHDDADDADDDEDEDTQSKRSERFKRQAESATRSKSSSTRSKSSSSAKSAPKSSPRSKAKKKPAASSRSRGGSTSKSSSNSRSKSRSR